MKRPRRMMLWVALAVPALIAGAASAQGRLGGVSVDRERLPGGSRVEAWVSVVDPNGGPVAGLTTHDFTVLWDGRPGEDLEVVPVVERDPRFELTVVLDPDLLRERGSMFQDLMQTLAAGAGERDQLRLAIASGSGRSTHGPMGRAGELLDKLQRGDAQSDGHLYDAIFREVRSLARLPRGRAGAVLVVTQGRESGSRHDVPEVLAISRAYAQHVPVIVLLLDRQGVATDAERLSRLGVFSGGGFDHVDNASLLGGAARRVLERLRGSYFVSFRDPRFDSHAERHAFDVSVTSNGEQRTRHREVITADSMPRPWWQGPLPLVVLGMVILLGLLAVPLFWRRPLLRLEVMSGEEKGCAYELYATPVRLGAAVGNDLCFDDDLVSRNHAEIERRGSAMELVDLNSENGTFVNGERVSRHRIAKGDQLSLGGAVELRVVG